MQKTVQIPGLNTCSGCLVGFSEDLDPSKYLALGTRCPCTGWRVQNPYRLLYFVFYQCQRDLDAEKVRLMSTSKKKGRNETSRDIPDCPGYVTDSMRVFNSKDGVRSQSVCSLWTWRNFRFWWENMRSNHVYLLHTPATATGISSLFVTVSQEWSLEHPLYFVICI